MTKKLQETLKKQKKSTRRERLRISGTLGIPIAGQQRVEVPNRNAFVFVKLRDNQSEVIQAYNNKVAPSYGLPVIVEWQNNRYVIIDVDTTRYQNNWNSFAPFLPRHGNTHSFDLETGGGGDIVWVHSRQFLPSLVIPSGTQGAPNVFVSPYTLRNSDGTWKQVGNTGTASLTPYKPITGTQAVMALVYLDSVSGNPYLMVGSGSYFPATLTGTAQITPYIPQITNPAHIPLAAVRLVTGTSNILWNNIYDVRQFLHPTITGSGGSGGISNLTGTTIGLANKVVLTNSNGQLTTMPSLGWGNSSSQTFIEFGANVTGKETNAGRMGYQIFQSGYLEIVGAGSSVPNRWVLVYDNLKVNNLMQSAGLQILDTVSNWIYLNSTGLAVHPINAPELLIVTGTDRIMGMEGLAPDFRSVQISVNNLAEAINTDDVIGTFLDNVSVPASTTFHSCPWKPTANSSTTTVPWPDTGIAYGLVFRKAGNQPASGSMVVTLLVNGVDSGLTVTVPAGDSGPASFEDNTHSFPIVTGDALRWTFQNNATGASAGLISITMKLRRPATA